MSLNISEQCKASKENKLIREKGRSKIGKPYMSSAITFLIPSIFPLTIRHGKDKNWIHNESNSRGGWRTVEGKRIEDKRSQAKEIEQGKRSDQREALKIEGQGMKTYCLWTCFSKKLIAFTCIRDPFQFSIDLISSLPLSWSLFLMWLALPVYITHSLTHSLAKKKRRKWWWKNEKQGNKRKHKEPVLYHHGRESLWSKENDYLLGVQENEV